ncbi:MAG: hypothetical protein ACTSQ4_04695 [Candidatus Heimdallarchaeaceae archaeon]
MQFQSSISPSQSRHTEGILRGNNAIKDINEFLEKLKQDIFNFKESADFKTILDEKFEVKDSVVLHDLLTNWYRYLDNVFNISDTTPTIESKDVETNSLSDFFYVTRKINSLTILNLDSCIVSCHNAYKYQYAKMNSDKIYKLISNNNLVISKLRTELSFVRLEVERIRTLLRQLSLKSNEIVFHLQSLNDIFDSKDVQPILNLFELFELNQAIDILTKSNQFYIEKRWDKSVHEIRICLEIIVNWAVIKVLNDSNWNSPLKDGLEILKQKGIINDEHILNHFRAKHVGIYGILSIKGVHPDGITNENLAQTEEEAQYCRNIGISVIEYLLKRMINHDQGKRNEKQNAKSNIK